MKRPAVNSKQDRDPDDLSFYLWDHLNVPHRLDLLEFKLISADDQRKNYVRSVPLARGYKHERARRPACYCHITLCRTETHSSFTGMGEGLHVFFQFGWFRKNPSNPKKHYFVTTPDGQCEVLFNISEHKYLEEFACDMRDVIRVLHERRFENITELYAFMQHWTGRLYWSTRFGRQPDSRLGRALAAIKKEDAPAYVPPPKAKPKGHRMGRPIMRRGTVSYRGR